MGIFSFFGGASGSRDAAADSPATRDRESARAGHDSDRHTAAEPASEVAPAEPGAGLPDLEPIGREPDRRRGDTADAADQGRLPPDWWRSGLPADDEADQEQMPAPAAGTWNYGALFEAPQTPPPSAAVDVGPSDPRQMLALKPPIVDAISTIFDPEIPVNIYELGLIYDVIIDANARVLVRMTLTSPACPSAQQLPSEVQYKVKAVPGVADAAVEVVWDPPWTKDMMSDAAKLALGLW